MSGLPPGPPEEPGDRSTDRIEDAADDHVAAAYGSDSIRRPQPPPDGSRGRSIDSVIVQAARFAGVASVMTAALLIGGLGGRWLDRRWSTHPWLMLLGLLLGVALCFWEMFRLGRFTGAGSRGSHQGGKQQ